MANELMILPDRQILEFVETSKAEEKTPYDEDILLVDVLIDAMDQTNEIAQFITTLSINEELTLRCSQQAINPFSVEVLKGDKLLGYIPQVYSIIVSRLMKAGKKLTCKVSFIESFETLLRNALCNRLICKIYLQD